MRMGVLQAGGNFGRGRFAMDAAHQQADLLDIHIGTRMGGDRRPSLMTARVSQSDSSSSRSWLMTTMADPPQARSTCDWWMAAAAPASTPQVGWLTNQHVRLLQDFPAHDVFLQIAARQRTGHRARPERLDGKGLDDFGRIGMGAAGIDHAARHHAQPVARRQDRVVGKV